MYRVFTHRKNKKYVDILEKLVNSYNNSYNNSYHRSIRTSPNSVKKKDEKYFFENLDGDLNSFSLNFIKFKFNKGEYVRIPKEKTIFEKGYTANFSKEIYIISKQVPSNPPRYKLIGLDGEE